MGFFDGFHIFMKGGVCFQMYYQTKYLRFATSLNFECHEDESLGFISINFVISFNQRYFGLQIELSMVSLIKFQTFEFNVV